MKLWLTTTENKFFVKMLWHLLDKCVKTIVLLVYSSGTVATEFFFFFFLQSSTCTLKKKKIYKNPHIYCYTDTTNFTIILQLLRC